MGRHIKTLGLAIALGFAGPVIAGGLDDMSNQQLCVAYATTIMTGHGYTRGHWVFSPETSQADIMAALQARGETCEPNEMYMQAATYQLQERHESHERAMALSHALSGYANQRPYVVPPPPAQAPKTTDCHLNGDNVTCTTWP